MSDLDFIARAAALDADYERIKQILRAKGYGAAVDDIERHSAEMRNRPPEPERPKRMLRANCPFCI